ncbi:MAG: hypothetical protein JWN82_243 [Candidatus Saccharibacteria bacterium]|nr:hypothetical protein [Candidatus Saccharibacteria bacterium]
MDFLDPKKRRQHAILLYSGYVLIGIAILISTMVLVYQANGFGVNSKGQVVQNGLVFLSSQPNPADISLNGHKKDQTNTRLSLPAGRYDARLTRAGYRDWQRSISVQGGDVQHFDYPFLFPKDLVTKNQADYAVAPGVSTQSPDRRWLLVQQTPIATKFDLYDLKNPAEAATALTLPTAVVRLNNGQQSWAAVQWADDNQHVLLKHTAGTDSEFILVDRNDVAKSVNLNQTLGSNPLTLTLIDNKYDKYNLLDSVPGTVSTASLDNPTPVKLLDSVLSYKSYGSKTMLYATADGARAGKANIVIAVNGKQYSIREVSASNTYLLDMASYRGAPYVVLGAVADGVVYIYRDPVGQLSDKSIKTAVAIRAIKVVNPSYVSFSPTAQYIVAEGGTQFGVYDIFLKRAYVYTRPDAPDAPQAHAEWMDGNRLTYVSGSKLQVFDYDQRNHQTLMPATAGAAPFFSPDYKYVYAFTAGTAGAAAQLTQTTLLTAADL